MKEHFIKLFNYDRFANLQILDNMVESKQPLNARQLMAHLLAAQQMMVKAMSNTASTERFSLDGRTGKCFQSNNRRILYGVD